jgi:hypothetical protein
MEALMSTYDMRARLREIERQVRKISYEDMVAELDACEQSVAAEDQNRAQIALLRLIMAQAYHRGDDEIAQLVETALPIVRAQLQPPDWALALSGACSRRPALELRFLSQITRELRAHLDHHDDAAGEELHSKLVARMRKAQGDRVG